MPYMVSIGNHERDWPKSGDRFPAQMDSGGECGVAHERRFLMPSETLDAPWCGARSTSNALRLRFKARVVVLFIVCLG